MCACSFTVGVCGRPRGGVIYDVQPGCNRNLMGDGGQDCPEELLLTGEQLLELVRQITEHIRER